MMLGDWLDKHERDYASSIRDPRGRRRRLRLWRANFSSRTRLRDITRKAVERFVTNRLGDRQARHRELRRVGALRSRECRAHEAQPGEGDPQTVKRRARGRASCRPRMATRCSRRRGRRSRELSPPWCCAGSMPTDGSGNRGAVERRCRLPAHSSLVPEGVDRRGAARPDSGATRRQASTGGSGGEGGNVLRQSFATALAAAGGPLPALQKLMGHQYTVTMTRRSHVSDDSAREASRKCGR